MSTPSNAPTPEQAAGFYDEMWQRYAHLDSVSPAAFHRRRLVVDVAARNAPSALRILDAGCGQGELLDALARRLPRAHVSGADVSAAVLANTRSRAPNYDLFLLDLASSDFSRDHQERLGTFDLIVCSEVLEHIADDAGAASRLSDLAAPGATVIVTVPGGAMSRFDVAIGHHRHYRARDLARTLEEAGMLVDDVLAWGFPFHSLYRSAVRVASRYAIEKPSAADTTQTEGGLSKVLSKAYSVFGRALKPAFYLNLDRWGEQMIAVARKPRRS